tara:strand:+ start:112 stop:351 length:240 start_codon:yes stop_codon:yes gene_type:complete
MEINLTCNNKNQIDFTKLNTYDMIKVDDGEETFWAIVYKKLRNCLIAKIDNKLLFEKQYNYGDLFKCRKENIIDSFKIN